MENQPQISAKTLAQGSIYLTVQHILSGTIVILGFAFLARTITQEEMGVVAGLILFSSFIQLIASFGFNAALATFVAEQKGRGEDFSTYVLSALSFRLSITLLLTSIPFFFSANISSVLFKTDIYSYTIKLVSIDIVLQSLIPLLNSVLWGSAKLRRMAIYGTSAIVIRWCFIILFLLNGYGINGVIFGWMTGNITILFVLLLTVSKTLTYDKNIIYGIPNCLHKLLGFSWPLYLASTVSFSYDWFDRAIALFYLPLSYLGVYNMAYMAFTVLATVSSSLGSALFPYYGMAHGRNDQQSISLGIKRVSKYTMLIIFPFTLGLLAASKPVITLFAGQQYEGGWHILAIFAFFGLIYGISPAFSNLLLIYGKTRTIFFLNLIPIISSVVILPFLWIFTLSGLAVIRGISLLLNFLFTLYFIRRLVNFEIDKKALVKILISSVIMAIIVLLFQQILYSPLLLPLYGLLGATIYFALIRILKPLNQDDVLLLKHITGDKISNYIERILGYGLTNTS